MASKRAWSWKEDYREVVSDAVRRSKEGSVRAPLRIRVLTYNILANRLAEEHYWQLYQGIPKWILDFNFRLRNLCAELELCKPDVVCLQEVEGFEQVSKALGALGFVGEFVPRTGLPEGCATFWRSDAFRAVRTERVEFADHDLKQNVAIVHRLRSKEASDDRCLWVANIHVLFNPKRGDIKVAQCRVLLDTCKALMAEHEGDRDLAVCGDFNSAPNSGVYEFVRTGALDCLRHDRRYLSGQVEGICVGAGSPRAASARETNCFRLPQSELAEEEEATTSSRAEEESATGGGGGGRTRKKRNVGNPNKWSAENLRVATGEPGCGVATHPLDLRSAYVSVTGSEPDYTSAHRRFLGTVDYIWHTPSLRPLSALLPVPWEVLSRYYGGGLPNKWWPSDHMSLCCDFLWTGPEVTKWANGYYR